MKKTTILKEQSEIAWALEALAKYASQLPDVLRPLVRLAPPKGARAQVSLRYAKTKRQVKRNAPADSWTPESGMVSISYDLSPAEEADTAESGTADGKQPDTLQHSAEDPGSDLVLALARAEDDPQLGFVSLKWFRDTYLPRQGYSWAAAPDSRQRVLADAISRNWILTSKLPNPKNPQYPVTAIRVNRPLAEVRRLLEQEAGFASTFDPITIPGEHLSETVLRERR